MDIDSDLLATLATKTDVAAATATTREEMKAAIAPLATREELAAAIAPLVTREQMTTAIAEAIAPLATREEMTAAIRAEGERTRHYFDVVTERLQSSISLIAESYAVVDQKIDNVRTELKADTTDLDRRVTRLEAQRRTR